VKVSQVKVNLLYIERVSCGQLQSDINIYTINIYNKDISKKRMESPEERKDTDENICLTRDSVISGGGISEERSLEERSGMGSSRRVRKRKRIDGKLTFEASCPFSLRIYQKLLKVIIMDSLLILKLTVTLHGKERGS